MKKLITACQVLIFVAVISTLALGVDQVIRYDEAMVGRGHPTLADTLNRGFLIQHGADGVHTIVPYSTLTGVPTTFPYDNLTGVPLTFPYDNLTGVPAAFSVADNSLTNAKMLDSTLDLLGNKFTGLLPKAKGGWEADVSAASGVPFFASGTITWDTITTLLARAGVVYNASNNTWSFAATATFPEVVSTCSPGDNTCYLDIMDSGPLGAADMKAGRMSVDNAANCLEIRNSDNTVTYSAGCMTKTFSFAIDNVVVSTDNVLLTRVPRTWTITRADCYASTDNVVGALMKCATDNVLSCTVLDAWSVVTSGGTPFSDTSMTDGAVAAGAWLRWSTTSVGTTNSNKLSCTIQYRD